MALYPAATKRLITPGPNDPPIKARVVILHVAATEATSLYNYFNGPSGGVESHFYVKYDGSVEQYRDTAFQADANVMANDFAISIETQGLAGGTWTDAQLASIKALLAWCHATHGVPLSVPKTWDGSGVGYHILFEDQWDQRHAVCPGPNRINQFNSVLVPWMATGGTEDDMAQADVDAIKKYVEDLLIDGYSIGGVPKPSLLAVLVETQRRVTGVSEALKALASTLPADAAKKVLDSLNATYEADVVLKPKE